MKKYIQHCVLCAFLFSANSYSQDFFSWDNFKIRKTFESKTDDDNNPAIFSITMPKDKDDFLLVNAGIGYEYNKNNSTHFKNSISAFFVFNQNNQIDKEQLNHKIGMASTQTFDFDSNESLFGTQALQYLNDINKKSKSLLATSYWQYLNKKNDIKIGGYAQSPKRCLFNVNPIVGVEYQNIYKAADALSEGFALRGYFNLGANFLIKKRTFIDVETVQIKIYESGKASDTLITPSSKELSKEFWKKGLELKLNYAGRYTIDDDLQDYSDYMKLYTAELVAYPFKSENITFGISYNKGENPIDGLGKQEFWLFAFKFKK